jgi:hypothetical protein
VINMIENTEARDQVLAAFEIAATKKAGKTGSKKTLTLKITGRDGDNKKHIIYGSHFTIIETVASPIYTDSYSILREEPAMIRYYGRTGVLVHEEMAG